MTSFFVSGLEMAAELTYPEPEGNPTSIINWMFQVLSRPSIAFWCTSRISD